MAILKNTEIATQLTTQKEVESKKNIIQRIDLKNCVVNRIDDVATYKYEGEFNVVEISSNYTVTNENVLLVDCSSGNIEISLGYNQDREIYIKKVDNTSNNIILKSNYGDYYTVVGSLAGSGDYFGNYGLQFNEIGDRLFVAAEEDEGSGNSAGSGVVYVFDKIDNNWQQTAILTGSFAKESSDSFGEQQIAVNADGTVIAVSAKNDELSGTSGYGVFYILKYVNSQWRQELAFTGSVALTNSGYDTLSLNAAGDVLAVGISRISSNSGITYIYRSGSAGWFEENKLTGSLATSSDQFGKSVALSGPGNKLFISAISDELSGTGGEGLLYVFNSGSSGWTEETRITGSLGLSQEAPIKTDYSGNVLFTAYPGATLPGYPSFHGVGYIFRSGSSGWIEEKVLTGSLLTTTDSTKHYGFGDALNSAAMTKDANTVFVGAYGTSTTKGYLYKFVSGSNGWFEDWYMESPVVGSEFAKLISCNYDASTIAIAAPSYDLPVSNKGIVYIRGEYLKNINGAFSDFQIGNTQSNSSKVKNLSTTITVTERKLI